MNGKLINMLLDNIEHDQQDHAAYNKKILDASVRAPLGQKNIRKVSDRTMYYHHHSRGQWIRPEYDFDEIQIAQDTDSYMFRAIQKKVNKLLCAGFEFTGKNADRVDYIKRRIREIELATQKPFILLMGQLYADIFRFSNCVWVKARNYNASSGDKRKSLKGKELEPVAGYFILPMETILLKTHGNGELKKVMQRLPTGAFKEFFPEDIIHFWTNRKPGFSVGTPELWPALDDIQLLRRIEENVEELIETNLFPVFHYKVGTDQLPERVTPEGLKESDVVKQTIEYMPAAGVYVSDHRHQIQAVGSEGRALRIDFYLTYFKNRALAALGTSSIDMGEGDSANRSTASTMSKAMIMDVEAAACIIKSFFDFYIINELLLEGGFDPTNDEDIVEIKFGDIDKDEKRAHENHVIQSFTSNVRDMQEVRKMLGERPWEESQLDLTHYKMFEEPSSLIKSMSPGSAASETLSQLPVSNISPEALKKEQTFAKEQTKQAQLKTGAQSGAKSNPVGTGSKRAAAARNRPSNQHGTLSTAKTNKDLTDDTYLYTIDFNEESFEFHLGHDVSPDALLEWKKLVYDRYNIVKRHGVSLHSVAENMLWRLN